MEFKQIQELLKAINKSNISELTVEEGDFKITIKQAQTISETQFVAVQAPAMAMPQAAPAPAAIAAPAPAAAPAQPAAAPAAADNGNLVTIKSPMIGTFYRSSGPDKPPFVNVGDEIKPGQAICIIEAMKLFNEIESEQKGKIVKVLVDDASPVEYDQPLFLVEPA
jgi:acetyl-CoA carboxylase biotin carboxyl carrier protein